MLFYNTFTIIFLIFFDMFLTEKKRPRSAAADRGTVLFS